MSCVKFSLVVVLIASIPAMGQEYASVPFSEIRKSVEAALSISPLHSGAVRYRVRSTSKDLAANKLRLWIEIDGEKTELEIGENGTVNPQLPSSNLDGDVWLRSNSPKGTLLITAFCEISLLRPKGTRLENALLVKYSELFNRNDFLRKIGNAADQSQLGLDFRMTAKPMEAVIFTNKGNTNTRVAMKNSKGTQEIKPDERGTYRIPFDRSNIVESTSIILVPYWGWSRRAEMSLPKTFARKAEQRDKRRVAEPN